MSNSECEPAANGRPTVEYCVNNVTSPERALIEECDGDTVGYPCLERCGTCQQTSFLVVDGELRREESHRKLIGQSDGGDESE